MIQRLLFVLGAIGLVACSTTPEDLCAHTNKVIESQFGTGDPHNRDPKAARAEGVRVCAEFWTGRKETDPKAYDCYADCAINKKHPIDIASCRTKCYPNEPRPEDEL